MSQFSLRSLRDTLTIVRSYETWLQEEIKGKSALINAISMGASLIILTGCCRLRLLPFGTNRKNLCATIMLKYGGSV